MLVRQLIGRYAGDLVEMAYADALACLSAGTVEKIEAAPQARAIIREPQAAPVVAPTLTSADATPSLRGRRRRG